MEIIDYSNRRGAIVHLLPQVYAMLKKDRKDMPNIILWNIEMKQYVLDINIKWVFALAGKKEVLGILFYRVGKDGSSLYIEELQAINATVAEALIKKFEQTDIVKTKTTFYASQDIKRMESEEILETVGLQDESVFNEEGYQPLGSLNDTVKDLRLRYIR